MDLKFEIPETQLENGTVPVHSLDDLYLLVKKLESSHDDLKQRNTSLTTSVNVLQAEVKLLHSENRRLSTEVNALKLNTPPSAQNSAPLSNVSRQNSASVLSESKVGNIPAEAPKVASSQPSSSPFLPREKQQRKNPPAEKTTVASSLAFQTPASSSYLQKPKQVRNQPSPSIYDDEEDDDVAAEHEGETSSAEAFSPFETPSSPLEIANTADTSAEDAPQAINEEFNDDWAFDEDLNLDPDVENDFWGHNEQNDHNVDDHVDDVSVYPAEPYQKPHTLFPPSTTLYSVNLQKPTTVLQKPLSRPSIELTPGSSMSTVSFASTSASSAFLTPIASFLQKPKEIKTRPIVYDDDDEPVVTPVRSSIFQKPQTSPSFSPVAQSQACVAKFKGDFQDDGSTGRFDGHKFPHSAKLQDTFKKTFGLHHFRKNQLQAINAALLGEDCFILMPTGGGKSLCYQLPALCLAGVTMVISPLRSLIQDQTQHLQFLNINAKALSSDVPTDEQNAIFRDIQSMDPQIKLLYVTPEKVTKSERLKSAIKALYDNGRLNRFVIDEAHCVSQWGHDFRPDYKQLSSLRRTFRDVPMMALTATANPRVRGDILTQLGMRNPKWFMQSFNRVNLKYELRPKIAKNAQQELIDLINTEFRNQCGIVYCLSKNDCDELAAALQDAEINAVPYHAGLEDSKRSDTQKKWTQNKVKIVCATIAFGMGIDKPDVRFVVHYSLPKSIEGYYQETGRAGRDGKPATCILFYSYVDAQRNRKLIMRDDNHGTHQTRSVHLENLKRVVQFCENKSDCRRAMLLEYFGEVFDRSHCKRDARFACDNCQTEDKFEAKDVTEEARAVVRNLKAYGVGSNKSKNMTLIQLGDILKGSKNLKAKQFEDMDIYGLGVAKFSRTDLDSFVRKLVVEEVLEEEVVTLKLRTGNTVCCYIKMGKKADALLSGRHTMFIHSEKDGGRKKVATQNKITPLERLEEDCYIELTEWIREVGERLGVSASAVFSMNTLNDIARELPANDEELLTIDGVTEAKLAVSRTTLMPILNRYRERRRQLLAEEQRTAAEPKARKSTAKKPKKSTVAAAASPAKRIPKPRIRALESSDDDEPHTADSSIICIEDSDGENVEEGADDFSSPYFVSTKPGGGRKRPSPSTTGGTAKKKIRGGKNTSAGIRKGRKSKATKVAKGATNGWRERPKKNSGDSNTFSSSNNPPIFTGRLEGTLQRNNYSSGSFGTNASNRSSDPISLLRKPQGAPKVSTCTSISKDWMMPAPK